VIERLYASDLAFLQRLYEKFNGEDDAPSEVASATRPATAANGLRRMTTLGEA
jgi:hypothetical protein